MRLCRLKIANYKSFKTTSWLKFGSGFNVVVGQNNAGKTALLETLRLRRCDPKPYRGLSTPRPAPLLHNYTFELELSVSGTELTLMLLRSGASINIPTERGDIGDQNAFLQKILSSDDLRFGLTVSNQTSFQSEKWPSHGIFVESQPRRRLVVRPSNDRTRVEVAGSSEGDSDDLPSLIENNIENYIYVFRPERRGLGRSEVQNTDVLAPDSSNLPAVLLKLQANVARFERLNDHVRSIFPSIKQVVVVPSDVQAQHIEIRLWTVDPRSERDDLAIKLEESGTGVGQVLGILYVAMTREANVIAIDEPNSFLHPGAAKKLLQILMQYQNQYIIATHSAELIAVADPDTLHLVRWNGEQSVIEHLDRSSISSMYRVLTDVGASLADVFGADRVVWVEGPTEQTCFPKILTALNGRVPLGLVFAPLRNTGDLEAKGTKPEVVWEIYERLTKGVALLPPAVAFSFDREGRKQQQIDDMTRRSQGTARFLNRATYENFLVHPRAIASVLIEECKRYELKLAITEGQVEAWLTGNCEKYARGTAADGNYRNEDWLRSCNAPMMLQDLFNEITGATIPYRKLTHSIAITEWLLENDRDFLAELSAHANLLAGA